MALPPILQNLRIPAFGAPLFIIQNPDLVLAQCKAGIPGCFPALNAREKDGEPIELDRLDWRPQYYNNKDKSKATRANVSFYLPIEAVVETLDNVCGPHGWQSHLSPIGNGPAMICSLSIYAPDHNAWITKSDAGFIATTQNDGEATTIKGSASDALKRAAQLWGVGRFIKKFPDIWVAWDPSKKQATEDPIHALRTKLGTGKIVKYDDLVAAIRAKGWSKEWVFETLGGAVQDYMGKNGGSYQDIFSVLSAAAER